MRISILTIGAIASILTINSVLADTTVTSKQYVDTEVAKKQDKIESAMVKGVGDDEYTSIASYDDEGGLVANKFGLITGERLFEDEMELHFYLGVDDEMNAFADKMVPTVAAVVQELWNYQQRLTCAGWPDGVSHTDENCWLWSK